MTAPGTSNSEWGTPQWLFDMLGHEYGLELDVCATPENAKCKAFFTKADDGLTMRWCGRHSWMNPPYGRELPKWIEKAAREADSGARVVGLIPSRTCTRWFHDHIHDAGVRIHAVRGRLQYDGPLVSRGRTVISPPFGSLVVVWGLDRRPRATFGRSIDARAQGWGR